MEGMFVEAFAQSLQIGTESGIFLVAGKKTKQTFVTTTSAPFSGSYVSKESLVELFACLLAVQCLIRSGAAVQGSSSVSVVDASAFNIHT